MGCIQSRPAKRATSYVLKEEDSPRKRARSALLSQYQLSGGASSAPEEVNTRFDASEDGSAKSNKAVTIAIRKDSQRLNNSKATRPDPKDFMFSKLQGETRIREPGSVNGQQFIIEDCEDCNLLIFDTSATITIDNCKRCCIFLGPIDGSLFARNCSDCKFIAACRQFRTRECERCDVFLFCSTRPIIESSSEMRFGCFDISYAGLEEQMAAVKMSPWVNLWSEMYDFTPASGGGDSHWGFLPENLSAKQVLEEALKDKETTMNSSQTLQSIYNNLPLVIFRTWGNPSQGSAPSGDEETECFALFPGSESERARTAVTAAMSKGLVLMWTNSVALDARRLKTLLSSAPNPPPGLLKKLTGNTIGISLRGIRCKAAVESILASDGGSKDVVVLSQSAFIQEYRSSSIGS